MHPGAILLIRRLIRIPGEIVPGNTAIFVAGSEKI
jgi:hypothetical protein